MKTQPKVSRLKALITDRPEDAAAWARERQERRAQQKQNMQSINAANWRLWPWALVIIALLSYVLIRMIG